MVVLMSWYGGSCLWPVQIEDISAMSVCVWSAACGSHTHAGPPGGGEKIVILNRAHDNGALDARTVNIRLRLTCSSPSAPSNHVLKAICHCANVGSVELGFFTSAAVALRLGTRAALRMAAFVEGAAAAVRASPHTGAGVPTTGKMGSSTQLGGERKGSATVTARRQSDTALAGWRAVGGEYLGGGIAGGASGIAGGGSAKG